MAQKPLVGDFDWSAIINPPQNSSRPLHQPHSSHYESPFQQFDLRPGMLRSTADFFFSRYLAAHFTRQFAVLVAVLSLVACAIALVALGLFLCGAKRRGLGEKQQQQQQRHFYDDQGGFVACEKGKNDEVSGPDAPGNSFPPSETRREFGLKAGGGGGVSTPGTQGAAAVSLKPDLAPFHVSVHLI